MTPRGAAGLLAAALAASFALPLALGHPYWQTVDDPFFAMIVHGFGVAEAPNPGTFYLAVLYGKLLGAIGTLEGVRAYDAMTYALLAAAGAASAWALWRAGASAALAAAALLVVFAPAALYPQYTVLAGLLAVAGLLVLSTGSGRAAAILACALLIAAGMVRAAEVVLAAAVTAPLWLPALARGWPARGWAIGALACAMLALLASAVVDRAFYAAPEWRQFMDMQPARLLFTDYGLRQYLMGDPLHAMRLGFVPNDLVMVEGWFFSDPRVFPPARLLELTQFVSVPAWWWSNVQRLSEFATPFADESFLAPLLFAVYALWRARARSGWWAMAAFGALRLALLVLGRPNTVRIYIPLLAGILFFALAARPAPAGKLDSPLAAALVVALVVALGVRNAADRAAELAQRDWACRLPPERLYVVWADTLPYAKLYPPFGPPRGSCPLRLYPLAVHSYAPYALEVLRRATGSGDVVGALLAGREINLIGNDWQVDVLRRHLRIHYGAELQWLAQDSDDDRNRVRWYRLSLAPQAKR